MQAIILAAGMGKRLYEYTKNNTKCMVPVNGTLLIDRLLRQLNALSLSRVVIVTGYQSENLIQHVGIEYNGMPIEYVHNPIYDKTNNIYSLALAKEQLQQDDTLLLESDLIFDDSLLDLLVGNSHPNLALVAHYEAWMDGTMVCIDEENNIINFVSKDTFDYKQTDTYYKTINIYKFSKAFSQQKYVPFLEAYLKAVGYNEYYENVLQIITFINTHDLKALPIKDELWYEIDDKQDLDIAEALFANNEELLQKFYGRYGGYWRFPKTLDYCYLVNPYFPSNKLINELKAQFSTLLTEYPSGMKVNSLLASKCWKVKEEYIVPGNGAAELIKILMTDTKGKIGIIRPTFEEYPNRLRKEQLIVFVPHDLDYRYNTDDLISYFEHQDISTLLLINPDNPSGNFIPLGDLMRLADWCENNSIRLIVDESFVDFCDEGEQSTLLHDDILESYPHLLVVKSISKSYGVPGLRLGIMASSDKCLIDYIKREVSIWNINSFAEYFMQIYTKHETEYKKACSLFIAERDDFEYKLRQIQFLRVMPSQANYFLVEVLPPYNAHSIVLNLLKSHNILTRDCSSKIGFDGKQYMRFAVRNHEENARLLAALQQLCNC